MSGDAVAGAALAATVFCMVLGSSSSQALLAPGRKLRWVALVVLAVVAVALAVRSRGVRPRRPLLMVAALGGWLAVLGLVSAAWSVDTRLSFERAVSFAIVLALGSALAYASLTRPQLPSRLLYGVLAGTVLAALVGVAMLAVAHGDAVQFATTVRPVRFRGLGENPDTASMLEGLVFPIALWALLRAGRRRDQLLALAAVVLLIASISASGSRGGLLAMAVGGVVFGLAVSFTWQRRLVVVFAVCLATFAAAAGTQIPKPLTSAPAAPVAGQGGASGPTVPQAPVQSTAVREQQYAGRLTDELFRNTSEMRSLFVASGRLQAWYEGIKVADLQPLLGYGFGTEASVFVDRIYAFQGDYVENSLIGFYIQLGAIGLLSLLALFGAVSLANLRAVRHSEPGTVTAVAPLAGVFVAGLALLLVQSYVYSVGNVSTVTFWTVAYVGSALACAPRRRRADASARQEDSAFATG